MPTKTIAKSVLVNPDGKILVLRRSPTDTHSPGRCDFPGGSVEEGESIVAAAVREIREEAGLAVEADSLTLAYAFTSEPNKEGVILTRMLFVGKVAEQDVVLSHEHDAFWWHDTGTVLTDFDHTSWRDGLQFMIKHGLLA